MKAKQLKNKISEDIAFLDILGNFLERGIDTKDGPTCYRIVHAIRPELAFIDVAHDPLVLEFDCSDGTLLMFVERAGERIGLKYTVVDRYQEEEMVREQYKMLKNLMENQMDLQVMEFKNEEDYERMKKGEDGNVKH